MYSRILPFLLATLFVFLGGCQGGKSKSGDCAANAQPPYNQCKASTQCTAGQTLINGRCQIPTEGCGVGFSEVNGSCKPNSLECPPGQHQVDKSCVKDQLNITIASQSACWIPETGAARVIVQYTAKDQSDRNLIVSSDPDSQLQASFFVDNRPMDPEAQINTDSTLLNSDLVVSLVLDASYSMLQHSPPAFEPMKTAAKNILHETQNLWAKSGSKFDWRLMWFDYALFTPTQNMAGESWDIDDIANIPAPKSGTYTALYKAINKMVDTHRQLYANGVAAGPRDQHIMIILSDGGDNQSHVDNSTLSEELNNGKMLYWKREGGPATNLTEVKQNVASMPNLRTFVIGFGTFFDGSHAQALKDIAASGHGLYLFGANTSNLDQLFHDVQTEFVTLQTLGAEVPLPPKTYTFSLLVKHPKSSAEGRKDFTLNVGPSLGTCTNIVSPP